MENYNEDENIEWGMPNIIIDRNIIDNKELSWEEKVLYVFIMGQTRHAEQWGYCTSENWFIGDSIGLNHKKIQTLINSLEKKEYVVIENYINKNKTKTRMIFTNQNAIKKFKTHQK